MNNSRFVTRLILLGLAVLLGLLSLFSAWGRFTMPQDAEAEITIHGDDSPVSEAMGEMAVNWIKALSFDITGFNGGINLGFVTIPYWTIIILVELGLLGTIWNTVSSQKISRKLVTGLLLVGTAMIAWATYGLLYTGPLRIGTFLLLAASLIGLSQQKSMISPSTARSSLD